MISADLQQKNPLASKGFFIFIKQIDAKTI